MLQISLSASLSAHYRSNRQSASHIVAAAAADVDAPIVLVSLSLENINSLHIDEEVSLITFTMAEQLMLVT